jgi:hypothetical protein
VDFRYRICIDVVRPTTCGPWHDGDDDGHDGDDDDGDGHGGGHDGDDDDDDGHGGGHDGDDDGHGGGHDDDDGLGMHASFTLPTIRRGAAGRVIYQIQNLGNLEGFFDLRNVAVTNLENGCTTRERAVDSTCGSPGPGQGELGAHLGVTVVVPGYGTVYTGSLNGLAGDHDINEWLAPSGSPQDTLDLQFNWHLPASTGAIVDGDSASLDMDFVLSQDP